MQKLLIVAVVVLVCLPVLLSAGKGGARRPKGRRGGEGDEETAAAAAAGQRKDCGRWENGPCTPKNGTTCGAGTQTKTRSGDNCPVKEKTTKCNVPCSGAQAGSSRPAAGGRGKTKAAKCKYVKGEWSSCDSATNMKSRTLTLKTSRRNAAPSTECEQTKVETRKCAQQRKNRRGPGAQ